MGKRKMILIFLFIFFSVFAVVVLSFNLKGKVVLKSEDSTEEYLDGDEGYDVSTYITADVLANTQKCNVDLCLKEEYTPELIGKDADEIVIASVISLDNAEADKGLFGITTGKILINQTLKGDLEQGQVVEYMKNGGVMKMSDWEKTQPQSANEKRQYLREQSGVDIDLDNTYIDISVSDDVDIEAGYTYLIYLVKNGDKYEIIGLGAGLRKVNLNYANKIKKQNLNVGTLEVMNNKTGEFESLENYINTYINNSEKE